MANSKTQKKSRSLRRRGAAAVCAGALLLGAAAFLMLRQEPQDPTEPSTAAATLPDPIPSNPYSPEDFVYEGDFLTCTAAETATGVDVSSYQGEIDWQQVRSSGVDFAMIRLGYRGTTEGGIYPDEYAMQNLRGASEAGLQVGAYFFSQAVSPEEAVEEAAFCISLLEQFDPELPVVFDWEYTGSESRTAFMDSQTLLACTKVFCDAVEDAGYEAMVYFNPHLAETILPLEELLDYPFWLAMYKDEMTYPHAVSMWQYRTDGKVPGISGDTDLNLMFIDG